MVLWVWLEIVLLFGVLFCLENHISFFLCFFSSPLAKPSKIIFILNYFLKKQQTSLNIFFDFFFFFCGGQDSNPGSSYIMTCPYQLS